MDPELLSGSQCFHRGMGALTWTRALILGRGGVDSGGGGFRCLDSVSGGKRGMGIRLGRDSRGGWAEENCRTTPKVRTAHCLHILIS